MADFSSREGEVISKYPTLAPPEPEDTRSYVEQQTGEPISSEEELIDWVNEPERRRIASEKTITGPFDDNLTYEYVYNQEKDRREYEKRKLLQEEIIPTDPDEKAQARFEAIQMAMKSRENLDLPFAKMLVDTEKALHDPELKTYLSPEEIAVVGDKWDQILSDLDFPGRDFNARIYTGSVPNSANYKIAEYLMPDPGLLDTILAEDLAVWDYVKSNRHSALSRLGRVLQGAQTNASRMLAYTTNKLGIMSDREVESLIYQSEVTPSDYVDMYWKPETPMGRTTKAVTMMASDIVLDPLVYLGLVPKVGQMSRVGSTVYHGLEKMSEAQRMKIFMASRAAEYLGQAGLDVERFDAGLQALAKGSLEKHSFVDSLKLGKEEATRLKNILDEATMQKSLRDQMARGELSLTYAGKDIPISDELRKFGSVLGGRTADERVIDIQNVADALASTGLEFSKDPAVSLLARSINSFRSRVANPIADEAFTRSQAIKSLNNRALNEKLLSLDVGVRQAVKETGLPREEILNRIRTYSERIVSDPEAYARANSLSRYSLSLEREGRVLGYRNKPLRWDFDTEEELDMANQIIKAGGKEAYAGEVPVLKTISEIMSGKTRKGVELKIHDNLVYLKKMSPSDKALIDAMTPTEKAIAEEMNADLFNLASVEEAVPGFNFKKMDPFLERTEDSAKRYFPHVVTQEFNARLAMERGIEEAEKEVLIKMGGAPSAKSHKIREDRRTINAINAKAQEHFAINRFESDPLVAYAARHQEHFRVMNFHNTLKDLENVAIRGRAPHGYVRFEPMDFLHFSSDSIIKGKVSAGTARERVNAVLPEFFKIEKGKKDVFLPSDVYAQLKFQFASKEINPAGAAALRALRMGNYFFRNSMLFGLGYQGKNLASNLFTYATVQRVGNSNPITQGADIVWNAPGIYFNKFGFREKMFNLKRPDGTLEALTGEQIFQEAALHGVVSTGSALEMGLTETGNAVRRASQQRSEMLNSKMSPKTLLEAATLWGVNRLAAQAGDDIPKLAFFLRLRRDGHTAEAAARLTEKYLYNFSKFGKGQAITREVFPFTSFSMKTGERVIEELKGLEFARLAMPKKTFDVISAQYLEDEETRNTIRNYLPSYMRRIVDRPIVAVMPGGKYLAAELPFAYSSLDFIGDEANRIHPALQVGLSYLATKSQKTQFEEMYDPELVYRTALETAGRAARRVVPGQYRVGLELWAGQDSQNLPSKLGFGEDVDYQYRNWAENPTDTSKKILERTLELSNWIEGLPPTVASRFLVDFMYGDIEPTKDAMSLDPEEIRRRVIRANVWSKYLSQGFAGSVSPVDVSKYYAISRGALEKRIDQLKSELTPSWLHANGFGMVELGSKAYFDAIKKTDKGPEYLRLNDELKALDNYFDYLLNVETERPGLMERIFTFKPIQVEQQPNESDASYEARQRAEKEAIDFSKEIRARRINYQKTFVEEVENVTRPNSSPAQGQ